MGDIFEGSITEATSLYSQYEPGSAIMVRVAGEVKLTTDYAYFGIWETLWEAFDETGKLLGRDSRKHSIAFWTRIDTAFDAFELPCGAAPGSSFNMRIKLSARSKTLMPFRFVDDLYVRVVVFGSSVNPPIIPIEPPTLYPAPAPKPAPTPKPIAPAPTPGYPEPVPTPTPTPAPGDMMAGLQSKWLVPGLVIGAAVLLLLPGKKDKGGSL